VYVIDASMIFGLDDREPVVLKAGVSFYEQPGALRPGTVVIALPTRVGGSSK
jgi:hypothetical protein